MPGSTMMSDCAGPATPSPPGTRSAMAASASDRFFLFKGLMSIDGDPWRTHHLRRTLATGLQRLGVRFEIPEAVLDHRNGSRAGVAGAYQRRDRVDERRAVLAGAALRPLLDRLA